MRVIIDTNIVLDVLLAREPFFRASANIFSLVERSEIEALLCATTITTVDYLLTQSLSPTESNHALHSLLDLFEIAPVNRPVLEEALKSGITDFEDAVMEQSGRLAGAEAIVTRNTKDFRKSRIKVLDSAELLAFLGNHH
ncbi:MAG: PIN domain-containing protein [Kiritimatiellia bacterium]|nr:PIN domain-containing protein [Kiritimatiellia bacterium]